MDLKINNVLNSNSDIKQLVGVKVLKESLLNQKSAADQIINLLKEPGIGNKVDVTA
jgi:hypothetical protein